ncbi:MAG TPA: hypothetical protein VKV39_02955 [Candidatus Sulfotelmatobacter sp.]|nr:hypothetical protein [Candidatus Sulfotelmatobacter sp.]
MFSPLPAWLRGGFDKVPLLLPGKSVDVAFAGGAAESSPASFDQHQVAGQKLRRKNKVGDEPLAHLRKQNLPAADAMPVRQTPSVLEAQLSSSRSGARSFYLPNVTE